MTIDDSGAATRGTETRAHARIAAHVPRGPHDASALFTVPTNSYGNREPRRVIPPLLSAPRLTHFACQPGSRNFWVIRPASPLITLLLLLPFFRPISHTPASTRGGKKRRGSNGAALEKTFPPFREKNHACMEIAGKRDVLEKNGKRGKGREGRRDARTELIRGGRGTSGETWLIVELVSRDRWWNSGMNRHGYLGGKEGGRGSRSMARNDGGERRGGGRRAVINLSNN